MPLPWEVFPYLQWDMPLSVFVPTFFTSKAPAAQARLLRRLESLPCGSYVLFSPDGNACAFRARTAYADASAAYARTLGASRSVRSFGAGLMRSGA